MGARSQAVRELMGRYGAVVGYSWARRKESEPPRRLPHERQFLPAALALQETPVHPAPRAVMWVLIGFAVIALSWAFVGRVDIVATATGKIIPNDRTKLVQPLETAVVKAIHVRDGQSVMPGDLLVELDATNAQADAERLSNDVLTVRFEAARARAMLEDLEGRALGLAIIEGGTEDRRASEQRVLEGHLGEYRARLKTLSAEISRRRAELQATREVLAKLVATAPIARQRAQDVKNLMNNKFVSRHGYLELEQAAIEQEGELAAQRARLEEVKAALVEAKRQRETLVAETRRQSLDRLHEAEQKLQALSQELKKAKQRGRYMRLTAPVGGTVQQLAVHTVGGVVTPAQPLMVIVPRDNALEVESFIANKDIGFVYAGQEAQIKIETFPFTKYGTIRGEVQHVSSDAIQDENLGLVYAARVRVDRDTMQVEEKTVHLSSGMAVTVEIKTGKRRLIEYFLSPLLRYKDETLRER